MTEKLKGTILVTGGSGFIGSHVVRMLVRLHPEVRVVNFDALTYAGNPENLSDVDQSANYNFVKGDIRNREAIADVFARFAPDGVIHLAAESHVDRSITNPMEFAETNMMGTVNLLHQSAISWKGTEGKKFVHVSTDEVYGALGDEGAFTESTGYSPRSPYSASKAGSDHFAMAWHHTYGLPVLITNCSNNFGSHQFPEKLIPLVINNIKTGKPIPVYGKGENVRDWLWVEDHARALINLYAHGVAGQSYVIGGRNELRNIDLVRLLCDTCDELMGKPDGTAAEHIAHVSDRAGHDFRYAIDPAKYENLFGPVSTQPFADTLRQTVQWYLDNPGWLERVTSGAYLEYYGRMYGG